MNWHNGNPDIIDDAKLAKAAYSGDTEVNGWEKDMELSNPNTAIFYNKRTGKAKVAYRGTVNKKDIGTDALLTLGLRDKGTRFKHGIRDARKAQSKYGKENVSLTGHSLGAAISAHASRSTGSKATGFSTPWGLGENRTYKNFSHIGVKQDPVNWTTFTQRRTGGKTWVKSKSWNPHALSNFV
jgi:hypothetical protein